MDGEAGLLVKIAIIASVAYIVNSVYDAFTDFMDKNKEREAAFEEMAEALENNDLGAYKEAYSKKE